MGQISPAEWVRFGLPFPRPFYEKLAQEKSIDEAAALAAEVVNDSETAEEKDYGAVALLIGRLIQTSPGGLGGTGGWLTNLSGFFA